MYFGLLDVQLYVFGFLFLIAIFFSWIIPGWVVLSFARLKDVSLRLLLSAPVGLALWGFQGYAFGFAGMRWLTYVYLLIFAFLFFRQTWQNKGKEFLTVWRSFRRQPWWLITGAVVSSLVQIYAHIGSGLLTPQGLPIYFVNSADGVMHLAYIQELVRSFPPAEPGAFGLPLLNYHYWSDLVQAELVRLWHLPLLHVFFQYAPIFLSIWTTALLLRLVQAFGGKTKALLVTLFVFTFGGDAAYLITQVLHGSWGEGVSSLDSGVTFYFNIPQVYARFVFLGAIFALLEWWQKKNFRIGLVAMMLIASLLGFKVYYAMYAALGLISVEGVRIAVQLYTLLRKDRLSTAVSATLRSALPSFLLAAFFGILAVAVYLPVNKSAGGLTYSFFEWPHLLLSADNINYQDWFLRMQVYHEAGSLRNIVVFNVYAVVLTFIAVYGTRLFGFLPFLWPPRTLNPSLRRSFLFFLPVTVVFLVFGLFTLQTSGGLNIFNFLIVPILFFNIWLALSLDRLSWKVFVPVFLLFAVLTLPRSVLQLQGFFRAYQQHKSDLFLSSEELEAFRNVQRITSKDAIVQALPNDRNNELSAYVSFFGGRRSYVAGTQHLDSHNQPGTIRQEELEQALSLPSFADKKKALQHLGVEYLYIRSEDLSEFDEVQGKALFQNEVVTLLSVSDLAE